jgi:hypothetical protein
MPVHDWASVEGGVFHDFHQAWTVAIRTALNSGLLPSGYSALVEQHAGGVVPDVLALQRRPRPPEPTSGGVLTSASPRTRHVEEIAGRRRRANRVVVRHRLGEVVCVIEIVSRSNKTRHGLPSFVRKAVELLENGVHLLLVDLFPPGEYDPEGIHKAICDEFEEETDFAPPADKPLTLAAYVAGEPTAGWVTRAYVEPIAVGDVLPDMPAYLTASEHVPVPLEATYQTAWAGCPPDMRTYVETGRLPGE